MNKGSCWIYRTYLYAFLHETNWFIFIHVPINSMPIFEGKVPVRSVFLQNYLSSKKMCWVAFGTLSLRTFIKECNFAGTRLLIAFLFYISESNYFIRILSNVVENIETHYRWLTYFIDIMIPIWTVWDVHWAEFCEDQVSDFQGCMYHVKI